MAGMLVTDACGWSSVVCYLTGEVNHPKIGVTITMVPAALPGAACAEEN